MKGADLLIMKGEEKDGIIITRDMTLGDIRIVTLEVDGYEVEILSEGNAKGESSIEVTGKGYFTPLIRYLGSHISITYDRTTIPQQYIDEFDKAWQNAKRFCSETAIRIFQIRENIENGLENIL